MPKSLSSVKSTRFGSGKPEDEFVVSARVDLDDSRNVMAGGAERRDNAEVAALVSQEAQRLVPVVCRASVDENDLFVSEGVGGVTNRCVDVVSDQPRVGFE